MATRLANSIAIPARKVERHEVRRWAIAAACFALLAFLSLLYLTQASAVATTGYDIKRLENEKKQWQAQNEQLRLKVALLKSLNRVEKEAVSRLGMSQPQQVVYVSTPQSARTVSVSSGSGDRERGSTPMTAAAQSPEETWWEAAMQCLPFSQRPLDAAAKR